MIIKVLFEAEVPEGASEHDIGEWIRYRLHAGALADSNGVGDRDLDAIPYSIEWRKAGDLRWRRP